MTASQSLSSNFHVTKTGTKTHYLQTGDLKGRLLICLHGLGGSVDTFKKLTKVLPQSYNIILVDFQGFGQTPLTSQTEPLTISGHVSDLHDLITYLQAHKNCLEGEDKIIFVGHSLGSIISLQYAAKYSSKVSGLALLGSGRSASHIPAVRQRMLGVAADARTQGIDLVAERSATNNFPSPNQRLVPKKNIEEVRRAVASSDPEGYARTCEMIVDSSHIDPNYAIITCPVVLVTGDMDSISPVQKSEDLRKLLGGETWVEVVKSGHQPLIDDPEAATSAITKLLQKI